MTGRGAVPSADAYSPQRRTALLLSGTGTAGAYHAGVIRALHEAGVKLDVVSGRGVGAVGALFTAVDGATHLWSDKGFWKSPGIGRLYAWRPTLRMLASALVLAVAVVAVPIAAVALGLIVFPIDFVLKMIGLSGGGLATWYLGVADAAFAPTALPTWLPRLAVLILGAAGGLAALSALRRATSSRHAKGRWWWRVVPAPLTAEPAIAHAWGAVWDLVRGAAHVRIPSRVELARRYTELLADNIGQPGFRELLLVAHDIDAGRDLVFALVADSRRRDLLRRPLTHDADARRAEVFDLAGVGRDHLADALAAALTLPIATDPHDVLFAADGYWRGETHRLCDRPGSLERLLQELAELDVEQVVLVSAAPDSPGPHALAAPRLDGRSRLGEHLRASEAATVRDLLARRRADDPRIFVIRPQHNPVGPFDFEGGFDDRSDRRQNLGELMSRGYEDAYHQFIEPIVGAP
ncbi:MAG: patatin-like phospholipase family protein [Vicinamibacterales bacterium]